MPAAAATARSTAPAKAERLPKVSNLRLEGFDPLAHFFVGYPGVGIERFGLRPQGVDARGVSTPLGDTRL